MRVMYEDNAFALRAAQNPSRILAEKFCSFLLRNQTLSSMDDALKYKAVTILYCITYSSWFIDEKSRQLSPKQRNKHTQFVRNFLALRE